MIDFMLSIFSTILQMDMRDHHEIPFALPIVMAIFVGGAIGFTVLTFIGNEHAEEKQDREEREV